MIFRILALVVNILTTFRNTTADNIYTSINSTWLLDHEMLLARPPSGAVISWILCIDESYIYCTIFHMVLDQENVFNFYQYLTQQNINSITIMKKIKFTLLKV